VGVGLGVGVGVGDGEGCGRDGLTCEALASQAPPVAMAASTVQAPITSKVAASARPRWRPTIPSPPAFPDTP
jgi:hypothetical protein